MNIPMFVAINNTIIAIANARAADSTIIAITNAKLATKETVPNEENHSHPTSVLNYFDYLAKYS
jgi:hypothetical protein